MTYTLRMGWVRVRQKGDFIGRRGLGVSKCPERPIFIFLLKKIGFVPWLDIMRSQAYNILLTKSLPFDSEIRQWSHLLMIPLHCLWAKLSNRMCGQFEWYVTRFCFYFDFVCSHVWCAWEGRVRLKLNAQGQRG